ncbi:MAG: undecaprenyldiphospho-muramoylpentapeptide beta-N-acetylglucosaminyltransferase [Patescibacteria group bacterium]
MFSKNKKKRKILLTGGGTGGSVTPLLTVMDKLQETGDEYDFLWLGSRRGVEKNLVEERGVEFQSIPAGKLRRYFSFANFVDPFKIMIGFFRSLFIILKQKPDLIMSAGSFVSVPAVWAGWICRVPVVIHQQDVRPGLANKLMAPFADKITVTFERSLNDYGPKAVWTGNPVKASPKEEGVPFNFADDLPVVLAVGGGTGSLALNRLIEESIDDLLKICQVIHITGKNRQQSKNLKKKKGYYRYSFLKHSDILKAVKRADIVVSRAGLGFLTEISYNKKPAILIPMPDSHQEDNARLFGENGAGIVLDQNKITAKDLAKEIKELINDKKMRDRLSANVGKMIKKNGTENVVKIVKKLIWIYPN